MASSQAILLVGPTGSGKTPLGSLIESLGLWRRRCVHFDFGEQLRAAAAGRLDADLTASEHAVITRSLESGALLEDHQFPIVEKILRGLLESRGVGKDDLLILNGMPRHVGQAAALARTVDVVLVVALECSPQVVGDRVRRDVGGDRAGRVDDAPEAIVRKLAIYAQRTQPLLDHYASLGIRVERIAVAADSRAEDCLRELSSREAPAPPA